MGTLTPTEDNLLQRFKKGLFSLYKERITKLCLFGSRARGEGHEESDLDVLVVIKKLDRKEKNHILDLACDLWLDSGIMISPLVMSKEHFQMLSDRERLITKEIQKDGIEL